MAAQGTRGKKAGTPAAPLTPPTETVAETPPQVQASPAVAPEPEPETTAAEEASHGSRFHDSPTAPDEVVLLQRQLEDCQARLDEALAANRSLRARLTEVAAVASPPVAPPERWVTPTRTGQPSAVRDAPPERVGRPPGVPG